MNKKLTFAIVLVVLMIITFVVSYKVALKHMPKEIQKANPILELYKKTNK